MKSSETITKIAPALAKAQSEMSNAKKDAINPFFKKNYADLNAIREAVIPSLNNNGISALQPTCVIDGVDFVETVLLHTSGEYISSLTRIVCDKPNDAQRHGSGLSYARRYALQSICNIGAEDDDANSATGKQPEKAQITQPEPVKPQLSPKAIVEAVLRVSKGEVDLIAKLQESFTLTPAQLTKLNSSIPVVVAEQGEGATIVSPPDYNKAPF